VVFNIDNAGSGKATDIAIIDSYATGGVVTTTLLPVSLGSLEQGNKQVATLVYTVPQGVVAFRTSIHITCLDAAGNRHNFPAAPPS
jgi:hypothetical protein